MTESLHSKTPVQKNCHLLSSLQKMHSNLHESLRAKKKQAFVVNTFLSNTSLKGT